MKLYLFFSFLVLIVKIVILWSALQSYTYVCRRETCTRIVGLNILVRDLFAYGVSGM